MDADEPSNNQRNNIISLSGKFNKRNFPDGWDDPKKFINQTIEGSRPLSSQVRSQENERNEIGKIIHLNPINTSLLLKIKKEELNEIFHYVFFLLVLDDFEEYFWIIGLNYYQYF